MKKPSTTPIFFETDIIRPDTLKYLVECAPDRQLLLATKLSFHHFLRWSELRRLTVEDFVFDSGRNPERILVWQCGLPGGRRRCIPIAPADRPVIRALLPGYGSVFVGPDIRRRWRRFARNAGVVLPPHCSRRSCLAYALAHGWSLHELAVVAGITVCWWSQPMMKAGLAQAAARFFSIPFDLDRIALLPQRASQKAPGVLQAHFSQSH